jgi:hypothetical protein
MRSFQSSIAIASCTLMLSAGVAFAASKPSVVPTTGQPGVGTSTGPSSNPNHSCATAATTGVGATPGAAGAASNPGSPFNGSLTTPGQAGNVYAGNPGTASMTNSNSAAAVSQYDIACFQQP